MPFFNNPPPVTPPFQVTTAEFTMALMRIINLYNVVYSNQTNARYEEIKQLGNGLDPNFSIPLPLRWPESDPNLIPNPLFDVVILKKSPIDGVDHTFLFTKGNYFALDNKKRHRQANPNADGLLGKGGIGKIKLGLNKARTKFAVKIQDVNNKTQNDMQRVCGILQKLNYLVTGIISPKKAYTVMTLIPGENLFNYLTRKKDSDAESPLVALKAAWAMDFVHQKGIIHGDIKIENFMITPAADGKKLILIDFDCAHTVGEAPGDYSFIYTNGYTAPELFSNATYSYTSDIYSLGWAFRKLGLHGIYEDMLSPLPENRPTLKNIIFKLQKLKEKNQKRDYFYLALVCYIIIGAIALGGILPYVSWIATLKILPIILTLPALPSLLLRLRDLLKNKAFIKTAARAGQPYEIDPTRFEQLKDNQNQLQAFSDGYHCAQLEKDSLRAKSWLHWRNYSYAFYAGARWCELHPQDEKMEREALARPTV